MILFPDQIAVLEDVRQAYREGARAPLLVAPTGFGKTVVFSFIANEVAKRGKRVMILVHRQELIDQVSETLNQFGVQHGIIAAQYPPAAGCPVQVASVFTVVRRVAQLARPDLIIIDEAHHAVLQSSWGKVLGAFHGARVLGVTATPIRLSGEGLSQCFDRLVNGPSVQGLIDAGRLSPVKVYAPPTISTEGVHTRMGDFNTSELCAVVDKPTVTGDAITHYQKLTPGQRAAVFCVSLEHCEHIAAAARDAGIAAARIDGNMDRAVRRQLVEDFKNDKLKWLVSCDLISEGFDCPGIEVGISLRPTQSVALWLQQCGRILRIARGKGCATILDHAGNSLRHGLPTESRTWSLEGLERGKLRSATPSVRVCPVCFSAGRSGQMQCTSCGHTFKIEPRTVERQDGELEEITPEKLQARQARKQQGASATLEQLTELGRMRNYKDPAAWARYVLAGREKKRQSA
jgi:superfamily II DNA or RNA helicase